jgi:hypothetical protein
VWDSQLGIADVPTMGAAQPRFGPYFHAQALAAKVKKGDRLCSVTLGLTVGMLPPCSRHESTVDAARLSAWRKGNIEMASLRGMFFMQLRVRSNSSLLVSSEAWCSWYTSWRAQRNALMTDCASFGLDRKQVI